MPLFHRFTSEERTRLRHAVLVIMACGVYSVISFSLLDGDPRLDKFDFLPEVPRFMLLMTLGLGSIITLAVAAWVTLYNGAFFFNRIRKRGTGTFAKKG